jgi:hypothetical protein
MADCWIGIRVFHILLGLLLVLNTWLLWAVSSGLSAVLLVLFGGLGAGAVVYHIYRIVVPGTLCQYK